MSSHGRKKLTIVLLEASLELVPPNLQKHSVILRTARCHGIRPSEVLLDKSIHYRAMRGLEKSWKRGRPDIVHTSLLILLDSMLNAKGLLSIYLHTIEDKVYEVSSETRIPRSYERFKGLMAQLLRHDKVPPDSPNPLIKLAYRSLNDFTRQHGKLILLSERGKPANTTSVIREALTKSRPIGIGMFPHGDFENYVIQNSSSTYSLAGGLSLKAWSIVCRIVCSAENMLGLTY
ncbi:MAG: 16S rRNA methyltransferase [Hyperthermus sp.]|nr:MAG: 16S rRNA methyltransferase [Hyperthermus sp.]